MRRYQYGGQNVRPIVHRKTEMAAYRKRTEAGLQRFKRWEKQFGHYDNECSLGMHLTSVSIGGKR